MLELVVDNFAGGGGASHGIERAIGRPIDVAINHDADAIRLHTLNHPRTRHHCSDIWEVDPLQATGGRPVALAWFSPDCKHFSKAKGGKPVEKKIRSLAWVVVKWAAKARPRVIMLENVEEFQTWCPLLPDGTPDKSKRGETFRAWVHQLEKLGYVVEWRELVAADYGAPTSRKRLFVIARRDGRPIVWPEATHGPGLEPYRTAAECIDWSHPCPSIFTRKKPLAENTQRRIANGIRKFVLESANPFILTNTTGHAPTGVQRPLPTVTTGNHHYMVTPYVVTCNHAGLGFRGQSLEQPMKTLTAARDAHGLVMPYFIPRHGERPGQEPRTRQIDLPMPTVTATANGASLVAAFLSKHYGGPNGNQAIGQDLRKSAPTVTAKDSSALTTAHLIKMRGTCRHGADVRGPMPTVTAGGFHLGEVRAFLVKYFATANHGQSLKEPLHTVTTRDRLGLVTVHGVEYQIVDIGMRMLQPRELFRAQGFPDSYKIDGFTKTVQVRLCGNAVCPDVAEALVRANVGALAAPIREAVGA